MRVAYLALTAVLALSLPAFAQHDDHDDGHHGNPHGGPPGQMKKEYWGDAPGHGPKEYRGNPHHYDEDHDYRDHDGHPEYPHVDGDRWIGHDTGRYDEHYRVDRPWAYGHWDGPYGREHVWHIAGGGPGRFWFNGWYWSVAPYDAAYCGGWSWADDPVSIYADPYHVGWYLAYNVRLGTYILVMYMGR